jgi:hypothetical protein
MSGGWAENPHHAAGGRRRYNKLRQDQARIRQSAIAAYLVESGTSLMARGIQRVLAERFGVSQQTISNDLKAIFGGRTRENCCPFCGSRALDGAGRYAIEAGMARLQPCNRRPFRCQECAAKPQEPFAMAELALNSPESPMSVKLGLHRALVSLSRSGPRPLWSHHRRDSTGPWGPHSGDPVRSNDRRWHLAGSSQHNRGMP